MDHDRLFKELISTFFVEFVDLLLPNVSDYLDRQATIVALDKEIFTDIASGDRHEVDLVMKAKLKSEEAFFLIHVENQSFRQSDFALRMFHYCARLMAKYSLPVYPVAIFTYDSPKTAEPDFYAVTIAGKTVIRFEYTAVQLNRIPWRTFAQVRNPVACALMAKLDIPIEERATVKLQCLRLLATLNLDPAKTHLIGGFLESYLALTGQELVQFERDLQQLPPDERKTTMEVLTYWEKLGLEIGRAEGIEQGFERGIERGKEQLVLRQIRKRFGVLPDWLVEKLEHLSSLQLDDLGVELLDFKNLDDVTTWFGRQPQS